MKARKRTREQLVKQGFRLLREIKQIFLDCEHWNRINPDEEPIDADPDGELMEHALEIQNDLRRVGVAEIELDAGMYRPVVH